MGALGFNKRGLDFITNWAAVFFVAVLILSFLLSSVIVNQWVNYAIVVFAGIILGHFLFTGKNGVVFPYYVISFAFLAGYLIGHKAGNGIIIAALFLGIMAATKKALKLTR